MSPTPTGVPTLEDLETALGGLDGKRILVRADFNVPLDDGRITDDLRIRAALPTLHWLTERGAVVTAHLGRPKGAPEDRYSLRPVAARLGELLGQDVAFATDTVGDSAQENPLAVQVTEVLQLWDRALAAHWLAAPTILVRSTRRFE